MLVKKYGNYPATLINQFWGENLFPDFGQNCNTAPAINITEGNRQFKVEVAAPGFVKEDFKVDVEKNVLEISATKHDEKEADSEKILHREFSYAEFKRAFNLPQTVDTEKIAAAYANGVLTVEIPKKDEATANPKKQIEIA